MLNRNNDRRQVPFNSYRLFGSVNVSAREIDSQERRRYDKK